MIHMDPEVVQHLAAMVTVAGLEVDSAAATTPMALATLEVASAAAATPMALATLDVPLVVTLELTTPSALVVLEALADKVGWADPVVIRMALAILAETAMAVGTLVETATAHLVALEEALVRTIPMAALAGLAAPELAAMTSMVWAVAAPKANNKAVMEVITTIAQAATKIPPPASSWRRLETCSEVTSCSRRVLRREETPVAMVAVVAMTTAMVETTTPTIRLLRKDESEFSHIGSLEPTWSASYLILV